jgi:polyhydroxybutyrate depolymerase
MSARAELNGCNPAPQALPANGAVSGVRYSGCLEDAEVVFYTIDGGGHTWPGGHPLPEWIAGYTSMDINASETMWAFFNQYTLP